MRDYKPAPFELAVLAAIISLRDEKAKDSPVENWFGVAEDLIRKATEHLAQPKEEEAYAQMRQDHGFKKYPFDEVLRETRAPADGAKKGKTMLGKITTRKGLLKAIRRALPKDADKIIQLGYLIGIEVDDIRADQARRALKRRKKRQ